MSINKSGIAFHLKQILLRELETASRRLYLRNWKLSFLTYMKERPKAQTTNIIAKKSWNNTFMNLKKKCQY